jgi:N-acetylmuramoyl-L-alanine amidase
MSKLIAIDDGHGMNTAGKRTPFFPGTTKFMHENEFNEAVTVLLKANLERCGFRTLMVAPEETDTPLKTRTDRANKANADLYISIHANALNGIWGNQQGVSTFHYPGSILGKKAATVIHNHLKQGTQQKDRGVIAQNFHVLRETKMPAVLVECAFMDNLREANLLLSDAFRIECADEICKGICEYFGVAYVAAQDSPQDVVNYAEGKILSEKEKWLKKATEDNDVYWLLKKFKVYDEGRK